MRKLLLLTMLVLAVSVLTGILSGCNGCSNSNIDAVVDSVVADTTEEDTIGQIIAEEPMPKAADELFDDFFFNFASVKARQLERIQFPLTVENGEKKHSIERNKWKIDHFFMPQEYYTLIFDSHKEMEIVKDTTVNHVELERINLRKRTIQQYIFNRIHGQWMLTTIKNIGLNESPNASFLSFYQRFAADSAFQVKSMNGLVTFTSNNPDNDFEMQTGEILPEQWPMFKPSLIPQGTIYNINYGQKATNGNQKVFVIRGIANGLETEMVFQRRRGGWKLVKFNG